MKNTREYISELIIRTIADTNKLTSTIDEISSCVDSKKINLCSVCKNDFATCDSSPLFGTGKGFDNVYECDKFIQH